MTVIEKNIKSLDVSTFDLEFEVCTSNNYESIAFVLGFFQLFHT